MSSTRPSSTGPAVQGAPQLRRRSGSGALRCGTARCARRRARRREGGWAARKTSSRGPAQSRRAPSRARPACCGRSRARRTACASGLRGAGGGRGARVSGGVEERPRLECLTARKSAEVARNRAGRAGGRAAGGRAGRRVLTIDVVEGAAAAAGRDRRGAPRGRASALLHRARRSPLCSASPERKKLSRRLCLLSHFPQVKMCVPLPEASPPCSSLFDFESLSPTRFGLA